MAPSMFSLAGVEEHVRSEPLQDEPPLGAHALGHAELHLVPFGGADHGDGDAGVARGGLQDDLVPGQLSALLGLGDHVEGGAVLDRTPGVAALELAQHPAFADWA